ncbi:MAG: M15 family metallopeptidase [Acidobacteriaceae bacterium]
MRLRNLFLALLLTAIPAMAQPQPAASHSAPLLAPGPKPASAPARWLGLIGEYGTADNKVYVLESGGSLVFRAHDADEHFVPKSGGQFRLGSADATFQRAAKGNATSLRVGDTIYPRLPFSQVSGGVFHIHPQRPVAELTALALKDHPPVEHGNFLPSDLVEVAKLDPSIHLDIRYATTHNFLGTPVYSQARAFLQRPAAEAVVRANRSLKPFGYGLLIHDAYRPWYVTKVFWDATPEPLKKFVADPAEGSRHNRGCAVDITLYNLRTGKEVQMTGVYDEMSDRSYANYPGGTSLQRWRRDLLRRAMEDQGFKVYEYEWWHFDYNGWQRYPILNVRFDQIGSPAKNVARSR